MAKPWAMKFYQSKSWRQCRAAYINKKFGLCERCLQNNLNVSGKIVHHKLYLTPENINNPFISLNHDNLELLCKDCHNKEHFEQYESTRSDVKFDNMGNIIER